MARSTFSDVDVDVDVNVNVGGDVDLILTRSIFNEPISSALCVFLNQGLGFCFFGVIIVMIDIAAIVAVALIIVVPFLQAFIANWDDWDEINGVSAFNKKTSFLSFFVRSFHFRFNFV